MVAAGLLSRVVASARAASPASRAPEPRTGLRAAAAAAVPQLRRGAVFSAARLPRRRCSTALHAAASLSLGDGSDAASSQQQPARDLVTLQAELDGATMQVDRDRLASSSDVFEQELGGAAPTDGFVLLGKGEAELSLLVSAVYHSSPFSVVRS